MTEATCLLNYVTSPLLLCRIQSQDRETAHRPRRHQASALTADVVLVADCPAGGFGGRGERRPAVPGHPSGGPGGGGGSSGAQRPPGVADRPGPGARRRPRRETGPPRRRRRRPPRLRGLRRPHRTPRSLRMVRRLPRPQALNPDPSLSIKFVVFNTRLVFVRLTTLQYVIEIIGSVKKVSKYPQKISCRRELQCKPEEGKTFPT